MTSAGGTAYRINISKGSDLNCRSLQIIDKLIIINAVQHILIAYIDRGFAFGALPPCSCLAASVKASMHSAAAVGADDRSVQREDALGMIYILLCVFLCFNALHGCIFLLSQYRQIFCLCVNSSSAAQVWAQNKSRLLTVVRQACTAIISKAIIRAYRPLCRTSVRNC